MKVVLAIHNHQPIGNADEVVRAATERAYRPLLNALDAAPPSTTIVVHNSGPLWEWWAEHDPDLADRFAAHEHIEFLGGGWYEPVLAAIPENDRVEQLRLMQRRLAELTGQTPHGVWLGERFWEPSLAGTLNRHELKYVVLDSENLPPGAPATRPHTLDYHGRTTTAFFIDHQLRHAVPDEPVATVVEMLDALAQADPDGVVVIGDDGEKFGLWDNGYDSAWLEELFAAVAEHANLEWATFTEALHEVPSHGHLELGTASYSQMMDWSSGHWLRLVHANPAAEVLWRKMIRLSRQLRRSDEDTRRHLLRSQCNDAYWHGAFGGSHLPHLRRAVATELIRARRGYDSRSSNWAEAVGVDWNADGHLDLAVELPQQSWVANHARAGLYYFDDKPAVWPVTDAAFPDRPVLALEDRWDERASPHYELATSESGRGNAMARFTSPGITKTIAGEGRRLDVTYELDEVGGTRFGPCFPVGVGADATIRVDGGASHAVTEAITLEGHRFRVLDDERQLLITIRLPGAVDVVPLTTVHFDENHERQSIHQGVLLWLNLWTEGTGTYTFSLEIM